MKHRVFAALGLSLAAAASQAGARFTEFRIELQGPERAANAGSRPVDLLFVVDGQRRSVSGSLLMQAGGIDVIFATLPSPVEFDRLQEVWVRVANGAPYTFSSAFLKPVTGWSPGGPPDDRLEYLPWCQGPSKDGEIGAGELARLRSIGHPTLAWAGGPISGVISPTDAVKFTISRADRAGTFGTALRVNYNSTDGVRSDTEIAAVLRTTDGRAILLPSRRYGDNERGTFDVDLLQPLHSGQIQSMHIFGSEYRFFGLGNQKYGSSPIGAGGDDVRVTFSLFPLNSGAVGPVFTSFRTSMPNRANWSREVAGSATAPYRMADGLSVLLHTGAQGLPDNVRPTIGLTLTTGKRLRLEGTWQGGFGPGMYARAHFPIPADALSRGDINRLVEGRGGPPSRSDGPSPAPAGGVLVHLIQSLDLGMTHVGAAPAGGIDASWDVAGIIATADADMGRYRLTQTGVVLACDSRLNLPLRYLLNRSAGGVRSTHSFRQTPGAWQYRYQAAAVPWPL